MNNKSNAEDRVYKSFEQWKAETFPKLREDEIKQLERTDMKKTGVSLANASFDNLFRQL